MAAPKAHAETRAGWPADCQLARLAELPMTLNTGHVVIPASANGKDLALGIDTGGVWSPASPAEGAGIARLQGSLMHRAGWGHYSPPGAEAWVKAREMFISTVCGSAILNWTAYTFRRWTPSPLADGLIGLDACPDQVDASPSSISPARCNGRLFKPHPCADQCAANPGPGFLIPFFLSLSPKTVMCECA